MNNDNQTPNPVAIVQPKRSSSWKTLQEGTDFVVDKKIGVITFSKAPKTPIRVTYTAGYEKTPEPISNASALLTAGFIKWLLALKNKQVTDANLIPKRTWKQVKGLIEPFRKSDLDKQRETLLEEVTQNRHQLSRLEESAGLGLYKDYEKLLKWTKEAKEVEELKKTRTMTKGAREPRVGPKHQNHQEPT